METVIEISKNLWLVIEKAEIENSGLFNICDCVGGTTMIDLEEIPALIEALKDLQKPNLTYCALSKTGKEKTRDKKFRCSPDSNYSGDTRCT